MKIKGYLIVFTVLLFCLFTASADAELLKLDKVEPLYIVWAEADGEDSEIYICRRNMGKWMKKEKLTDNSTDDFSPCIALDKHYNPWVIWVGSDGISTAIYSRYWNGEAWSNICQVDSVDLYSDTFPGITVSDKNIPYVVWSGSDGRDDDIYISSWNGSRWEPEEIINIDDHSPDLMPILTEQPGGEGLIISWMGYNGRNYELYYTLYSKGKMYDEKVFGFGKTYSFGECPGFIKSATNGVKLCWRERGNWRSVTGNGLNWSDEEDIDLSCKDALIVDLLNRLGTPIWIAWIDTDLRQSFRLLPADTASQGPSETGVNKSKIFTWISNRGLHGLRSILDIFNSNAYADTVSGPTKYIAFGDSITEGNNAVEEYPSRLGTKLNQNIGPSIVVNAGLGGERTFEGVDRIDSVLNEHNGQYLLLMEGTNDVTWHFSTESIIFNLGEIIDRAVAFGTTPLIAQLTPRDDSLDGRTHDEINPAIVNLAAEKNIICVDQYTTMATDKLLYMCDHIHPNEAGYELMSQTWFDAIDLMLNPPDDNGGGCGSVTLPATRGGDRGVNLGLLFILFVLSLWFRLRLRRT